MHVYAHSPSLTAGGVDELAAKFHISKPQYGLCKVANTETGAPQIALISWVSSAGGTRTRFLRLVPSTSAQMMRKGGPANILDGSSSLVELFVLLLFLI